MPNGKGALECCYCTHFQSQSGYEGYDCAYEAGICDHWQVEIPAAPRAGGHRICANFMPNESYKRHNRGMIERHGGNVEDAVQERMSWFGVDLEPGVLYAFCYNQPPEVKELMPLTEQASEPASDLQKVEESLN